MLVFLLLEPENLLISWPLLGRMIIDQRRVYAGEEMQKRGRKEVEKEFLSLNRFNGVGHNQ